jgi:hypothetical protein
MQSNLKKCPSNVKNEIIKSIKDANNQDSSGIYSTLSLGYIFEKCNI